VVMDTHRGPLPPIYFLSALAGSVLLHWLMPIRSVMSSPVRWTGLVVLMVGVLSAVLAAKKFNEAGTTIKPFEESSTLITDGLYRYTRNPMYLGMVLVLSGLDLMLGSLSPFLVVPLFIILIDRIFIRKEEQALRAQFGEQYASYVGNVRRWL
jgi:protein-S-isoprenylcysteine O-methyltransferase Ste14